MFNLFILSICSLFYLKNAWQHPVPWWTQFHPHPKKVPHNENVTYNNMSYYGCIHVWTSLKNGHLGNPVYMIHQLFLNPATAKIFFVEFFEQNLHILLLWHLEETEKFKQRYLVFVKCFLYHSCVWPSFSFKNLFCNWYVRLIYLKFISLWR